MTQFVWLSLFFALSAGASDNAPTGSIKYKTGKDINFEELLIQGQLKRPEISVVTGNTPQGSDGLLRLRTDFVDRSLSEIGEEIP
jgi:hypothetical protein